MQALLEDDLIELLDDTTIKSVSGNYPIYIYKNTKIGVIKTNVGVPLTVGLIEEIGYVFSCKKFVMFGLSLIHISEPTRP